jgi:hypothetical protein
MKILMAVTFAAFFSEENGREWATQRSVPGLQVLVCLRPAKMLNAANVNYSFGTARQGFSFGICTIEDQ